MHHVERPEAEKHKRNRNALLQFMLRPGWRTCIQEFESRAGIRTDPKRKCRLAKRGRQVDQVAPREDGHSAQYPYKLRA